MSSRSSNGANMSRKRSATDSIDDNASNQTSKRARSSASSTTISKPAKKNENISKYFSRPKSNDKTKPRSRSSSSSSTPPKHNPNSTTLTYHTGSIFSAPTGTLLLHACNCEGSWGGGIALAFRKQYPFAFKIYADHCAKFKGRMDDLVGTSLLIPPQTKGGEAKKGHWIGCLFTSVYKGKRKDSPEKILKSTMTAVGELLQQVGELKGDEQSESATAQELDDGDDDASEAKDGGAGGRDDETKDDEACAKTSSRSPITSVRMCKINSGLFNVEWERTVEVLQDIDVPDGHPMKEIEVWERKE